MSIRQIANALLDRRTQVMAAITLASAGVLTGTAFAAANTQGSPTIAKVGVGALMYVEAMATVMAAGATGASAVEAYEE